MCIYLDSIKSYSTPIGAFIHRIIPPNEGRTLLNDGTSLFRAPIRIRPNKTEIEHLNMEKLAIKPSQNKYFIQHKNQADI